MKKIFLPILAILIFGATLSLPVSALYIDSDEATWYTVPELLEYKTEVDQEKMATCGEDFGCQQEFYFHKMETETKFQALERLKQNQLIVTAINPEEEYIKVLFFDEDLMLSRMGIKETINLNRIYLGWLENDVERIYRDGMDPDKYVQNEIPGAHHIYYWQFGDATDNIIQHNTETTITATGINQNDTHQIIYNADSRGHGFSAYGRFNYSNCLSEPDYKAGDECRLMFSAEKGQAYYPPRETITDIIAFAERIENNTDPDSTNTDLASIDIDSTGLGSTNDEVGSLDTQDNNTTPQLSMNGPLEGNQTLLAENNTPKAPNTGAAANSQNAEFPWWLGAIIISGITILIWFFRPNHEKPQKSQKNS